MRTNGRPTSNWPRVSAPKPLKTFTSLKLQPNILSFITTTAILWRCKFFRCRYKSIFWFLLCRIISSATSSFAYTPDYSIAVGSSLRTSEPQPEIPLPRLCVQISLMPVLILHLVPKLPWFRNVSPSRNCYATLRWLAVRGRIHSWWKR